MKIVYLLKTSQGWGAGTRGISLTRERTIRWADNEGLGKIKKNYLSQNYGADRISHNPKAEQGVNEESARGSN